jgi:hypothetical protein
LAGTARGYPYTNWLEFRTIRSTLVPYVSLSIPRKHSGFSIAGMGQDNSGFVRRSDFIDRVIVGPSPNKDLSKTAVELFFQKLKMSVEVVSSTIPYRDW